MDHSQKQVVAAYENAKELFAQWGVDVDAALAALVDMPVSIHCWQGDDVRGYEDCGESAGGGTAVTGNYRGRARNAEELRADFEMALQQIPGKHRFSIHAIYAETEGKQVARDELETKYFENWVAWGKEKGIALDFNPTFHGHPKSADGFSLSSPDKAVRDYWIEHGKRAREIAAFIGKAQGSACINNFWMHDGYKDTPVDTAAPRERMAQALDEIFKTAYPTEYTKDAVESKLFGLGLESYTVASHEFSLSYALTRNKLYTLDAGHFHPTEMISAKISSILQFCQELLLHVSRGVRWDSDHVVALDDELQAIMQQIVRGGYQKRVHIGTDYFDASINRVAAWVIGSRNTVKAALKALLEPTEKLREVELAGDLTSRLALLEELKCYPYAAVWDYYCLTNNVPVRETWLGNIKQYECDVLSKRGN